MIKKYLGLSLITASMLVMGCSSDDDGPTTPAGPTAVTVPAAVTYPDGVVPTENIVELAGTAGLTTLASVLVTAGLDVTLADPDSTFTVFAPTDAAFAAVPGLDTLTEAELAAILQNHVVVGALDATLVAASVDQTVAMLAGDDLTITADAGGALSIGGAAISGTDNYATNGIVHLIDTVILPPAADPDSDGDTVLDSVDNCPAVANTDQLDTDSNGVGDACEPVVGGTGSVEQLMIDNGTLGNYLTGLSTTVNVQSFEDASGLTWTVFAPTDTALNGATVDNTVVQGSISVNGAYDAATLGARTEVTTNNNVSHAVVNNAGAITVGGFPVTLISSGNSVVYSIDGVLN